MASHNFKRKLTAILIADVKGYSRLMGEDDEATIGRLMECRELFSAFIHKHHGRVVDSPSGERAGHGSHSYLGRRDIGVSEFFSTS